MFSSQNSLLPHPNWIQYFSNFWILSSLIGGIPTPLKHDGFRQLGWWHSIPFSEWNVIQKSMFQSPPSSKPIAFCSNYHWKKCSSHHQPDHQSISPWHRLQLNRALWQRGELWLCEVHRKWRGIETWMGFLLYFQWWFSIVFCMFTRG